MLRIKACSRLIRLFACCAILCSVLSFTAFAQARRLVVVKVDGLPFRFIERYVNQTNTRTGKSELPWIKHVFYDNGTRLANFYTRGFSLSAPSWSMLDTGQHMQVKGNVEYDRYTLKPYDYLNFLPFFIQNALSRRVDSESTELLDELKIPILFDAYARQERYQSFQLNQRGIKWSTLRKTMPSFLKSRSPRELIDEWTIGLDTRNLTVNQHELDIIERLKNTNVRYLDYYTTELDHATHHTRDSAVHLDALKNLDALVGRLWTAIERSPMAEETALIIISDHGTNTHEQIYSQGFSLIELLRGAAGGAHHVITKRRPMLDYSIKGAYPFVPLITTSSKESFYLKDKVDDYPTVMLDFDGNERATVHLRNSDFNLLHILLKELSRKDLDPKLRRAATGAFFYTINQHRSQWEKLVAEMKEELAALRQKINEIQPVTEEEKKQLTKADKIEGKHLDIIRRLSHLSTWSTDERNYTEYLRVVSNLLSLRSEGFDPRQWKIEDLIPRRSMGDANTIYDLQNYIAGLAPSGLQLSGDGSLDMEESFRKVDYFALLGNETVRNNVQRGIGNRPVDFVSVRVPLEPLSGSLSEQERPDQDAVWLYGGRESQALILSRRDASGQLFLRYLPVTNLRAEPNGKIKFDRAAWKANLPLRYFEDAQLNLPAGNREEWLSNWHSELEWLRAVHQTHYSNGIIGLHEQFARHVSDATSLNMQNLSPEETLLNRYRHRQRRLAEPDLTILASDHWNFDVRGFNPGANHGSFFRASTHSTFMLAGGTRTSIPRGQVIEEPYDSLSFLPSVLRLTGDLTDKGLSPALQQKGFGPFPGRVIKEIFTGEDQSSSDLGLPDRRR
jgi:hypothetical protein